MTNTNNTAVKGKLFKQGTYTGYVSLVKALSEHTGLEKPYKAFSSLVKDYASLDITAADFNRVIARLVSYGKAADTEKGIKVLSIGVYRRLVSDTDGALTALLSAAVYDSRGIDPEKAAAEKAAAREKAATEKAAAREKAAAEKKVAAADLKARKKAAACIVRKMTADEIAALEKQLATLNPFTA